MSSNGVRAVLGIETAFKTVSVCLLDHNTLQLLALEELPLARGHAEALTPAMERVVQKSGLTFASVYGLAVSVGPGSFTGTRIGIAAAKALGATLKVPVWGVSALSAFAAPALRLSTSSVASVIDARNGLVYFQYHASDGTILFPASVLPIKTAVRSLRSEEVLVTGAGAEIFAQEAGWAGADVHVSGRSDSPGADEIALLAATGAADALEPRPLYFGNNYANPSKTWA